MKRWQDAYEVSTMKRMLVVSLVALLAGAELGVAGESQTEFKLRRPPGMPTNDLVAFWDSSLLTSDDLAQALGLMAWNFQVQVPDEVVTLVIRFSYMKSGKDPVKLGETSVSSQPWDSSKKRVFLPKQFRLLLTVQPISHSQVPTLREAEQLRIFVKSFLNFPTGSHSEWDHFVGKNPFRGSKEGMSILTTPQLVRARPPEPGVWDGFATEFDLIGDPESGTLRVSFY